MLVQADTLQGWLLRMDGYVSQHKGTLHQLKANSTTFISREKPFRPPFILIPESDSAFCDGCSARWPVVDAISHDLTGLLCDPSCTQCLRPLSEHVESKCLFGPGRYEISRYTLEVGS